MTEYVRKYYEIEIENFKGKQRLNQYFDKGRFKSTTPTSEEDFAVVENIKNMQGDLERTLGTKKIRVKVEVF
jgi:hypothetical protein